MGMPVRELLERTDSLELAEWRAFERALGPVGRQYSDGALAHIHEQLQAIAYLLGAQAGDENPVSQPQHYPRPDEVFLPQDEVVVDEQAEEVGDADALNAYFDQ